MSKRRMLIYTKTILRKVSFDGKLFRKELIKAMRILSEQDVEVLKRWVLRNYYSQAAPILLA